MTDSTTTDVQDASPVNATVYGQTIPIMFGSAQVLAAPLWAAPPIENADGSRIITAAYMLGYRDPQTTSVKLLKVFLNSSLAYSSEDDTDTSGAATAGNLSTFKFVFYDGDPDQQPDPTIVAQEGASVTPAFRLRMYIVIQGLYVPAGVAFPEITCEISQSIDTNNTRFVTPIPEYFGSLVAHNAPFFVDVPLGWLWVMDYGSSPQYCRVFDINQNFEVTRFDIDAISVYCTGRYTKYLFGKNGDGHLTALDIYGNLAVCPANSNYNGGIAFAKAGPILKDGTQFIYTSALGPVAEVYRFNPTQFTLVKKRSTQLNGPFATGCVPQPMSMNIFSKNNDCGLAYYAGARDINVCFDTLSGESVVGTRTCVWTDGDGVPGGKSQTDTLSAADVCQAILNMDVYFRDTVSEPNWAVYQAQVILTDPVEGKWVSILFVNGLDASMYWCKFSTVYTKLGVQSPGHTVVNGVNVPNPAPPLPNITDIELLDAIRYDVSLGISMPNVNQFLPPVSQVPDTETTISYPLGSGNTAMVTFDMATGLHRSYVHGHFVNTLTGQDYGTDPTYDAYMVWNSAKKGFYYTNLGGQVAQPGFCYLFSAPKNTNNLLISTLLTSICLLAGFTLEQIETTHCDNPVVGAIVNQATSYLDLLTSICQLWCIDIVESGGVLKFTRRLTGINFEVDKVLTDDDLAPVDQSNADDGTLIQKLRNATVTLPSQVQTTYLDSDNDFQLGSQNARRTVYPVRTIFTQNLNILTIGVPIAMDAQTALYWTELLLYTSWSQALQLQFRVSQAHMDLEPGDYVEINTANDGNYTAKITEVDLNTDMSLSITAYTVLAIPPDNQSINPINVISNSKNVLPSAEQGQSFAFWIIDNFAPFAGVGSESSAQLFCFADRQLAIYLLNTDSTYTKTVIAKPTVYGLLGNNLPAIQPNEINVPDYTSQLIVRNPTGAPVLPANGDEWRSGACAVAVGSVGRWEYIYVGAAVLNSDGSYTLSNLIRGQRGTDTVDARRTGDAVLFLTQSALSPISYTDVTKRQATVIGTYTDRLPTDAIGKITGVTMQGGSVREFAPMNIQVARVSNGVHITWNRRSRIDGGDSFADGTSNDPPLDQQLERYDVEIIGAGGAVIRTYASVPQASCDYSTADQNTDGNPVGNTLRVVVYQLSPFTGRGYGRDASCLVN